MTLKNKYGVEELNYKLPGVSYSEEELKQFNPEDKNYWTKVNVLKKIRPQFEEFFKLNNCYPSTSDIDGGKFIRSGRQLERIYGGIPALRSLLGLEIINYKIGKTRGDLVNKLYNRSLKDEERMYFLLVERFGEVNVHQQSLLNRSKNIRLDFLVFDNGKKFGIDIFTPRNIHSWRGCINIKMKKYPMIGELEYPVYMVNMNPAIDQETKIALANKKNRLAEWHKPINYSDLVKMLDLK